MNSNDQSIAMRRPGGGQVGEYLIAIASQWEGWEGWSNHRFCVIRIDERKSPESYIIPPLVELVHSLTSVRAPSPISIPRSHSR